jgi:GNAT superfamily N-acetyltransferase
MSSNQFYKGEFYWLTRDDFIHDNKWWNIYEVSFPIAERDTKEQLLLALEKNIARIGGYRIGDDMVGIVVFYRMKMPAFAFLHFLAIAPSWRNKRIGSHLFQLVVHEAKEYVLQYSGETLGLIWEVEDPEAAVTPADQQLQTKRIQFYHRNGGKLFQSKFIQPAINNQQTVPMQLMHHSDKNNLSELDIAKAIYFEKYQIINGTESTKIMDLLHTCYPFQKAA